MGTFFMSKYNSHMKFQDLNWVRGGRSVTPIECLENFILEKNVKQISFAAFE